MGHENDISRGYDTTGIGGFGNPGDQVKNTGAAYRYREHQQDTAEKNAVTNQATAVANAVTRAATPNGGIAIRYNTSGTNHVPVAATEASNILTQDQANYTAAQEAAALTQSIIDDPGNTNVTDVADVGTDKADAA